MDFTFDVVIIGAGAAGLMCAIEAGKRGRRVALLEHNAGIGAKILISGGGRCNFTNKDVSYKNYLSHNPHFCRSALSQYQPGDFIALLEQHTIAWHEKTLGQLFCDGSARQIVNLLKKSCDAEQVNIMTGVTVHEVRKTDRFCLQTSKGKFTAHSLVLATGGLSIPKMGATGFALDIAKQFGHSIIAPRPALVPLKADGALLKLCTSLAGVALPVQVRAEGVTFAESLLFTHRGLSGPAILQISSYLGNNRTLTINFCPNHDLESWLKQRKHERPKAEIKTHLSDILPGRLASALAPEGMIANLDPQHLKRLAHDLHNFTFTASATEGYAKAEVMAGGIDTDQFSSRTMESKHLPGLFAIGECLDVTGWLGGYNFQWAWSSGWCAGQAC